MTLGLNNRKAFIIMAEWLKGQSLKKLSSWLLITHNMLRPDSVLTFPPTGSQPAAGEEGWRQGQHPSHGNRQDSLHAQQLPALSSAEGRSRLIVRRAKWSPHLIRPLLTTFPWSSSRLKSSSRMSWREKSLEARVIRRCFHLRSLPSPKSECSRIMTEWFQQLLFLRHLKVKTHVQLSYRYYANTETYLKAVALKRMPPNLQTVDMLKAGTFILLFILPSS